MAKSVVKPLSKSRVRRNREREETRDRILDIARAMFVRRGYDETTMRAIADEMDYTATALYHHFQSKDELLVELCMCDFRALAGSFAQIGRIEDPIERIRRTGEAYVDFALTHPMQYKLMFLTPRPSLEIKQGIKQGDPSEDAYAFLRQAWVEAIEAGRVRPEFKDPDELAQMCWASLHGLLSLQIVNPMSTQDGKAWHEWREARNTAVRMSDALLRGLLR